jgi:hypothetical protein
MEAQSWLEHVDVLPMIRLAVRRARRMFDEYPDLNDESLVQDIWGECVKAKYDPTKCKPGTFAFRVATCRLRDISRRRTTERKHQEKQRVVEGVKLSYVAPAEIAEGTDEELAEILRRFYVTTKNLLDGAGVDIRPKFLAKSYPDKAQRYALLLLQKHMGWSERRTARELAARPKVIEAIGLKTAPKHAAIGLAGKTAQHLKKFLDGSKRIAAVL